MKYIYILSILLIFFVSCEKKKNFTAFIQPKKNNIELAHDRLHLDSIILNEDGIESSQSGFSGITHDKNIYFVDSRFCWYYVFDTNGQFKQRSLGQGGGAKETTVGHIAACNLLPDTSLFLLGHQLDHYIYNKNFDKKSFFILEGDPNTGNVNENWRAYTYQYSNLICRSYDNNKVFVNIYSEHPEFNYLEHLDKYLEKCYHLLEIDLVEQKAGKMYAVGYPPVYWENPYSYLIFSAVNFDIDNTGNFYVSYEADSLIYKYNAQYQPICSFGYAGKNMDINYRQIHDYKECRKYYRQERREKAYYDWIEYVDETGLLFRSYKKGIHDVTDGLQIYSDETLIADVSVPKGFKVAGYIEPYYYSQAIADEEKEILTVYRFRLNKDKK